jgi:uroporphyrinogen decarboxylase
MNSLERVKTVLRGQIPDRVPACLHNFMMAAREAGISMERYRADPNAIAQAHLAALEKYGHDCILVDTDTTMLAEAMGAKSACAPDEPGRIVVPARPPAALRLSSSAASPGFCESDTSRPRSQ